MTPGAVRLALRYFNTRKEKRSEDMDNTVQLVVETNLGSTYTINPEDFFDVPFDLDTLVTTHLNETKYIACNIITTIIIRS